MATLPIIKEETIQKTILQWVSQQPEKDSYLLCYHIENELPMSNVIKKALGDKFWSFIKMRKQMGLRQGVADLHFPNLLCYLELKNEKGKLSEKQKEFIEQVKMSHDVFVPRSSFEAVQILKKRMDVFKKMREGQKDVDR